MCTRIYFQSTRTPNVVWVELDASDFSAAAATRVVDPRDVSLSGSIVERFAPAPLDYGVPEPATPTR